MNIRTAPVLLLLLIVTSRTASAAPQTMRLDYFHSGNNSMEMFSLDAVVLESLPWTGNLRQPLDHTLRGKYLFEIVDAASGDISWSRSFSSIFGEWETTAEAQSANRTFHESLRFPRPAGSFHVVLKKRNAANLFDEIWRLAIDPNDYMQQHEKARYADQVVAIVNNGDPAEKVDLLLLGDGYTAAEHDAFIAKARELTDVLFATART